MSNLKLWHHLDAEYILNSFDNHFHTHASVSLYQDSPPNSTASKYFIIQPKAISQYHSVIQATSIDLKFGKLIAIHWVFFLAYGDWGMGTHRSKSVPSENNCLAKNNSSVRNLPDTPCGSTDPFPSLSPIPTGERHTVAAECKSDLNHFN